MATVDLDWAGLQGSAAELRLNRRDLPTLDEVIRLCPQRRVAVQAGACLGVYPKRLAQSFDTVYTFEPDAKNFVLMTANAPEPNIVRFQAALGCTHDLVGTCRQRRDGKPHNHEGITHIAGSGPVPTLRLDDFGLPVVDLLCLDCEGWDTYALKGGRDTLRRCRPVLMVEINKNLGYVGILPELVRDYITSLGYRFLKRFDLASDEVYVPQEWA